MWTKLRSSPTERCCPTSNSGANSRVAYKTARSKATLPPRRYNCNAMEQDAREHDEGIEPESPRESTRHISPAQARSLAIQTARETPGNYGRRFRRSRMDLQITELQEDEANYTITMSFRPEGPSSRILGLETFYITKEGDVVHREIANFPGRIKNWLPIVVMVSLGILAIGGPIVVSRVLSARGGADEQANVAAKVAIQPVTETPRVANEVPTATPSPAPTASPVRPASATPFPTPTASPTNTGAPREPKYKVGDELILTMGSGDTQRQIPAMVVAVFQLGDDFDPYWEYQVLGTDGLLRVQEFILSKEKKNEAKISYEKAEQSVKEAVEAGRMTEAQAQEHLTELVASGYAAAPSGQ